LADFSGQILHSADYKSANGLRAMQPLVIGGSFSAYEIAADIASHGLPVTHLFRRPSWIAHRYTHSDNGLIPLDLLSGRYPAPCFEIPDPEELEQRYYAGRTRLFGNPGTAHPALHISKSDEEVPVIISNNYLQHIKDRKITPVRGDIERFGKTSCLLNQRQEIYADGVILCTGYTAKLPIQNPALLSSLDYKQEDRIQPLVLNKGTLHPNHPSLGFVGIYRGPYFGVMEMQARWAAGVFSGQIRHPSSDQHEYELLVERQLRAQMPRPNFPRGGYVDYMAEFGAELGVLPHDLLAQAGDDSWVPMIPADFRRTGLGAKPELAAQQRNRVLKRLGL